MTTAVTEIESPGIVLAENGDAYIAGTSMKVRYIVIEANKMRRNETEIQESRGNLSIEQIRTALVYYASHEAEIVAEIRAENKYVRESRRKSTYRPTIEELRKERKLVETNSDHDLPRAALEKLHVVARTTSRSSARPEA